MLFKKKKIIQNDKRVEAIKRIKVYSKQLHYHHIIHKLYAKVNLVFTIFIYLYIFLYIISQPKEQFVDKMFEIVHKSVVS